MRGKLFHVIYMYGGLIILSAYMLLQVILLMSPNPTIVVILGFICMLPWIDVLGWAAPVGYLIRSLGKWIRDRSNTR